MITAKRWGSALAGAALAAVTVSGCGGAAAEPAPTPSVFTAQGAITEPVFKKIHTVGENCDAKNMKGLLKGGLEVKIKAGGGTVAMGKLESGVVKDNPEGNYYKCTFAFSVPDVPADKGFYTVDLGEIHGHKEFTEKAISSGGLSVEASKFEGQSEDWVDW